MNHEANFNQLLAEWRSIPDAKGASVEEWERSFETLEREELGLRERGAWVHGRDDLFGIVGMGRSELAHSAMVAWLLDPCARHGLGTRFLTKFLARAFGDEPFQDLAGVRVRCEVSRGECRADIVLELVCATVIVENKVDAEESPRQCDVLFERFGGDPGARFVFLTPTGRRPATATGEAEAAFAAIGYRDIRSALEAALSEVSVGSARHAAEDYLRTLRREFR